MSRQRLRYVAADQLDVIVRALPTLRPGESRAADQIRALASSMSRVAEAADVARLTAVAAMLRSAVTERDPYLTSAALIQARSLLEAS